MHDKVPQEEILAPKEPLLVWSGRPGEEGKETPSVDIYFYNNFTSQRTKPPVNIWRWFISNITRHD